MVKKFLLAAAWFPLSGILLILLLTNLLLLDAAYQKKAAIVEVAPSRGNFSQLNHLSIASSGDTAQVLSATVIAGDARGLLLKQFLANHGSPMTSHADTIVGEADKNGIDYRLVPAIAMCESNLGKRMPSKDSYNAWGIAVYTGQQTGATFPDWPTAIAWVSQYIKDRYYSKGITDLKKIGVIWAPPSAETNYSWTRCVEKFMGTIQ